jgi:integrating conjugative element protein (TIGR03765 family)
MVSMMTLVMFSPLAMASLVVVRDSGNTISARPYFQVKAPNQKTLAATIKAQTYKLENHPIQLNNLLYPAESSFTSGSVTKHRITEKHLMNVKFFVMSSDERSIRWAKENSAYLNRIRAQGIITNVDKANQTAHVEKETGLTLMPTNIDGLEKTVGTKHYPFLLYKGWVLQ